MEGHPLASGALVATGLNFEDIKKIPAVRVVAVISAPGFYRTEGPGADRASRKLATRPRQRRR